MPLQPCISLFKECFPMLCVSDSVISYKLKDAQLFFRYEEGKLTGFSAVDENSLLVLCVHPEFRNRGTGTELLNESESYIKSRGYDRVILGRSSRDLFWGAVMDTMSHRFFESRGYRAYNGCLCMYLFRENFDYEGFVKNHPCPDNVEFRIHDASLPDDICDAVNSVEPKWVRFYRDHGGVKVITAECGGRTAGFVTVDTCAGTIITDEGNRTGLPGYLGVVPEYRCRGIGLRLIAFASQYMFSCGCTEVFLNYTSLDSWYAGAGFEECLWYWMGEKNL